MTLALFILVTLAASVAAGIVGALLGLGGGIIVVPALALLLHVDLHQAIGASIVAVIATSTGAGAAYVRERLVNLRLAMFLELATTLGALGGAYLAGVIGSQYLYLAFAGVLIYGAVAMWRHRVAAAAPALGDPLADRLQLHEGGHPPLVPAYQVGRSAIGFPLSMAAGVVSGLLGVGGGIIKVPLMTLVLRVPLKPAIATSNFMIGVTAAASAGVYFARGDIVPHVAAPTAIGVLAGSLIGVRLMRFFHGSALRILFTIVLILTAAQMARRGMGL